MQCCSSPSHLSSCSQAGVPGNSITDSFCSAQKTVFEDNNQFQTKGGLKAMGDSLNR
jgi:cellulose 1,4-beta-cellobiosidase